MALREYTDRNGVRWMVWSVSSEALHPANRSEEFLRQFSSGWLCFESAKGEKRRLIDYPERWESLEDSDLEALGRLAVPPIASRAPADSSSAGRQAPAAASAEHAAVEEALTSAEFVERRRRDVAPPPQHPKRRQEDRPR